jgi:hypothetical protein
MSDKWKQVAEIVSNMRRDLEGIGGFDNGMVSVPAEGVRNYVLELESVLAAAPSQPSPSVEEVKRLADKYAEAAWIESRSANPNDSSITAPAFTVLYAAIDRLAQDRPYLPRWDRELPLGERLDAAIDAEINQS